MNLERSGIYLDHNATTPVSNQVKSRLADWLEAFGNPSSIHWAGRPSKHLLRDARKNLGALVHCDPLELIFTSGGSESNNAAIKGVFDAFESGWSWSGRIASERDELIISSIEHPSVMKTAEFSSRKGFRIHVVPVDGERGIDLDFYDRVLSEKTALVSMMFANNETGYQLPIRELCERAHRVGALFHCDAVQGLGKAEVNLRELGVDLASFSGHKFYALKGTGALYVKKGIFMESLIHGGGQERGRRAGTENVLGIASFGEMASERENIPAHIEKMKKLRDRFEARVTTTFSGVKILCADLPRICNTSSLLIGDVDGETLLMNLDVQGFAVSTGAACSSGNPEPSPVLLAMGLTREQAQSSLRVSLGWENTEEEIDRFVDVLRQTVQRLRSFRHMEGAAHV